LMIHEKVVKKVKQIFAVNNPILVIS